MISGSRGVIMENIKRSTDVASRNERARRALLQKRTTKARKLVIARAKEDESSAFTRACPRSLLNHSIVGRAESSESNSRFARSGIAGNLDPQSIVESDAKERERIFLLPPRVARAAS